MHKHFDLYAAEKPFDICASPKMVETLKKCYQIELAYPGKPYGPKDLKESFNGLYERGLLDIDISNKKLKTGKWYITTKGLQFLISISAKRINVNDPYLVTNINNLKNNLKELQETLYKLKVTSGRVNTKIA